MTSTVHPFGYDDGPGAASAGEDHMTSFRFRAWLAGTAAVISMPIHAQTVAAPAPVQDAAAEPTPAEPDAADIVVTGSRIVRPDFAAPNPIVSFDAANIQQSGNTNVTNFLQRVPALTNSVDSTQTAGSDRLNSQPFGAAGLNLLDLRGLGPARTLVLVNGRRHVAGQINSAAVDINSIPTDLIERVDVLTGSASAVYGADGVTGVVNFILKRDFEGVSARSQFGISQRGDAANRFASIQAGQNFGDGRGNVTFAYEYNADDPLANDDRSYLRQNRRRYLIPNDADVGDDPNVPDNVLQGDLRYPGESPFGLIDVAGTLFRGDGQLYDPGTPAAFYATGGDATPVAGFVGDLLPRIRRHGANVLTHYDFSDAAKLSLEGKFVQVRATTFDSPTGNYPATFTLDNAFLPASIRNAALAAGLTSVSSVRDNLDFGRHGESDRRQTWRGVADLTGRISDHATYDVYYTYGRTDVRITKINDRLNDRYLAALDAVIDPATGRATCRSNLNPAALQTPAVTFTPGAGSGCIPINTFGAGTADPASLDFFQLDNSSAARIEQHVVNASITGDLGQFFRLPGGPVQFATGAEYRKERSSFSPNDYLTRGLFYQYDEFVIPTPSRGAFDVWEAFGEVNAPILEGKRFAETLSVGAAGRYSDYSTIGSTRAYQFNGVYAPVRDISFRGSYGEAVRAPNIGELFTPLTGASSFFTDPCYPEQRGNGTATRAANCAALIAAAGGTLGSFTAANNPNAVSFIPGSQQGNPDLREETARTWTAGAVLRPRFIPGLTIAADWYDIRLRNAISTPGAQTIAELCVDQPTVDNVYCAAISRQQGTGYISGFTVQPQNVSRFRTAGLDLNIAYRVRAGSAGDFDIRFVGGYLHRLDTVATPGAQVEDQVDQPGRPKYNFVFSPSWTLEGLTLSYNLRWFDRVRRFSRNTTANNPDYAPADLLRYNALWQHDMQVQYALPSGFALYGGVNNLADRKPDEDSYDLPIPSLGRYFYMGAKVRFGGR